MSRNSRWEDFAGDAYPCNLGLDAYRYSRYQTMTFHFYPSQDRIREVRWESLRNLIAVPRVQHKPCRADFHTTTRTFWTTAKHGKDLHVPLWRPRSSVISRRTSVPYTMIKAMMKFSKFSPETSERASVHACFADCASCIDLITSVLSEFAR